MKIKQYDQFHHIVNIKLTCSNVMNSIIVRSLYEDAQNPNAFAVLMFEELFGDVIQPSRLIKIASFDEEDEMINITYTIEVKSDISLDELSAIASSEGLTLDLTDLEDYKSAYQIVVEGIVNDLLEQAKSEIEDFVDSSYATTEIKSKLKHKLENLKL